MADVRTLYRENAARGASPVRQVVMLYEQAVEDLRRASKAITDNNIEGRTNAINHAITVLAHLQSRLNMEAGGEVARNLNRFYEVVRQKLLEAQFQSSLGILEEQIALLMDLRDAWIEVDRAQSALPTPPPAPPVAAPAVPGDGSAPAQPRARLDWRG